MLTPLFFSCHFSGVNFCRSTPTGVGEGARCPRAGVPPVLWPGAGQRPRGIEGPIRPDQAGGAERNEV